jgi:hypothetical protein
VAAEWTRRAAIEHHCCCAPLAFRSVLANNTLNGIIPSSLGSLTYLTTLCATCDTADGTSVLQPSSAY